ncbi:MAG: Methyltransferase type 11, partial [Chitinophagaceae bacterium]|nr:Methyltransferase type 11 [Chitinophagaceae bacterium]
TSESLPITSDSLTITSDSLTISRPYCPVCKSKERSILLSVRHNSPGFLDFIKFERFYGKLFYHSYNNGSLKELLFEVAECGSCDFIYLTQVLSDTGMDLLYNEWLDKELLKEYYRTMPYNIYERTMLGLLKKAFGEKGQINVMDFGAGYGNFCSISTKAGLNTYAFDLSTDKNDHMKNMGVTIINNLYKYKGFFDFIYVNQVVEHVSDPLRMVKDLQQCLTDKGFIYLAVPDCKNAKQTLKKEGLSNAFFKYISPHQHINGFTNSTLRLLGTNAGLKPLSMLDFLLLFNTSLNPTELKYLIKRILKNSMFGTALFFKKN